MGHPEPSIPLLTAAEVAAHLGLSAATVFVVAVYLRSGAFTGAITWDEADYAYAATWGFWANWWTAPGIADLRHLHGPLTTYLIEASTATWPGELKRIEISGDAGSAILREEDLAVWKFAKETKNDEAIRQKMASRTQTGGGAADPKAIGYHGHMLQFQDVLNAIKKGKQPLIDGPEGRKAIELILAIYKSAETGKPVKLPLASDPALKGRAKGKKM